MPHLLSCPHCGHELGEAAGTVTCPGCLESVDADLLRAASNAAPSAASAAGWQSQVRGDAMPMAEDCRPCPMCGATIKKVAKRCRFCGETFFTEGGTRALEIGDCFNVSWKLLQNHWGMVAVANLVFFGIQIGMALLAVALVFLVAALGEANVFFFVPLLGLGVVLFATIFYVQASLQAGYVILLDHVLQGRPASARDLFAGSRYAMRTFVAQLMLALMALGGLLLCIFPAYLAPIAFWPFRFVIVHEEAGAFDSLKRSWELISGNFLVSLLLFLMSMACDSIGSMLCYVGLLFSHGLAELLFAVAYARLARRPILSLTTAPGSN
jgi:hypothetical protein